MDLLFKNLVGLVCVFFFFPPLYAETSAPPIICDQEYALCTSAPCIPAPGNSVDAICECVVEKGQSAGYKTCEQRKPGFDKYHATSLVSTFSMVQFATKKSMNCAKGLPWTNCVDMPCTVDPQNSKRALCQCKIDTAQAFFTFGGACDTHTCATGFWSGATEANGIVLRHALMQSTHLKSGIMPEVCGSHTLPDQGTEK